jgi:putative PIN family toxin of toxin-antitoxin system
VDLPTSVVIDTNVILDMFLYTDPRVSALVAALNSGELQWLATRVMREELARVLQYEHLQKRLMGKTSTEGASIDEGSATARALLILDKMDQQAHLVEVAPRASYVCKDVDDQKFIDLAQAHRSMLISKDKAVLSMKNRMARVGVQVMSVYEKTS